MSLSGLRVTTADRSFGAGLTGAIERGEIRGPVQLELEGSAGQSFGAFAGPAVRLRLVGQANDYVAKGLSGGSVTIVAEPGAGDAGQPGSLAGNTCLYGATGGRLHVVGRAGMRFAVRNAGAEAVVEGIGPHGGEYMTGGALVVLGPVGANFGAGMTGGRAFLYDPAGRHTASLNADSVVARRLSSVAVDRVDGPALVADLIRLVTDHADAGSELARRLLLAPVALIAETWLVEPRGAGVAHASVETRLPVAAASGGVAGHLPVVPAPTLVRASTTPTPERNLPASATAPNGQPPDRTLGSHPTFATE